MNLRLMTLLRLTLTWLLVMTCPGWPPAHAQAPRPATGAVAPQARWDKLSASIPDVAVLDHTGHTRKFYTDLVKGKTVAITFIFTRCTTVCPVLTATMRQVQRDLGTRIGRDVHLMSISVDPRNDSPESLQKFAATFEAGPGWTFVTGNTPDIDRLRKALGAVASNRDDHTPLVLIGNDAANAWTRVSGLAAPAVLADTIREALTFSGSQAAVHQSPPAAHRPGDVLPLAPALPGNAASYFTNLPLFDQHNVRHRFYDDLIKGKVVLINFMFTTCTSVCSPATANLKRVQDYLGDSVGTEVHFISMSVDPLHDTPEVLKKFADRHQAGPGWTFVTGKKAHVDWILYKLGGYTEDKLAHSNVLLIGNDVTGTWTKSVTVAPPAEIADAVRRLVRAAKS